MSRLRSGADVLLEILETEHVRHVFGNPGTTELPLIDALARQDRLRYVLALHESVAAGMADGYAQATGRPSFLNVHTATGLGNAMGNLSNSRATGTPMVVTAGQQDRRHLLAEPFLAGNLTGMAAGLVKWAHEVHRTADLGPVLRRAFHDAASPPTGPVFVSVPMDVLQDRVAFAVPAPSRIERRAVPAALPEIPVGIDGETVMMPTPVRCAIRPQALRVRVPRDRPGVRPPKPRLDWSALRRLASLRPAPARAEHEEIEEIPA